MHEEAGDGADDAYVSTGEVPEPDRVQAILEGVHDP